MQNMNGIPDIVKYIRKEVVRKNGIGVIFLKKLFIACLTLFLFACSAIAEDNLPEISFRGMKLGATAGEIATIFENEGKFLSLSSGDPDCSYSPKDAAYAFMARTYDVKDGKYNKEAILINYESSMEIAGHSTWGGIMCFVKPIVNGCISENEMDSIFYAGTYAFDISAKKDLKNKLTELYGKPEKSTYNKNEIYTWYGKNNTAIYMTENRKAISNFLGITYAWLGFDQVFKETFDYLEANSITPNMNSTSGL